MILKSLCDYYERRAAEGKALAPSGFEWKEIPFLIVIDDRGSFVDLQQTFEGEGRHRRAKTFLVPQGGKRSGAKAHETAFSLWDNPLYILGYSADTDKAKKAKLYQDSFLAETRKIESLCPEDPGPRAVISFLTGSERARVLEHAVWKQAKGHENMAFKLVGDDGLLCQRPRVVSSLQQETAGEAGEQGRCLVTAARGPISRLHPAIKGVRGAQSTGANIVSFNLSAFCSYGKEQGSNAAVGQKAAFQYTTSLNHLLGRDSEQKIQVGDATVVFWAEKTTPMESALALFFREPEKDDPDAGAKAVRSLYKSPGLGSVPYSEDGCAFYILGLAPNASRLSVRFWVVSTVAVLAGNIRQHFDDIEIAHGPRDHEAPSLFRLLLATAAQGKADNIPPNLAGDFMQSILEATPYPRTLWMAALCRSRAEQAKPQGPVPYHRAAVLKACLNREIRAGRLGGKEIAVALDETNTNAGYRMGRLFAVLEKAQEEANPGINATIRDRYFGAASSTPASVFPTLMRLKNHHVAKLENRGRAVNLEKAIGEVLDGIQDFPRTLRLEDQGRFSLGYYHQRQKFFEKAEKTEKGV